MIVLIASIVDIFVHIKQTLVMLLRTVVITIGSVYRNMNNHNHILLLQKIFSYLNYVKNYTFVFDSGRNLSVSRQTSNEKTAFLLVKSAHFNALK